MEDIRVQEHRPGQLCLEHGDCDFNCINPISLPLTILHSTVTESETSLDWEGTELIQPNLPAVGRDNKGDDRSLSPASFTVRRANGGLKKDLRKILVCPSKQCVEDNLKRNRFKHSIVIRFFQTNIYYVLHQLLVFSLRHVISMLVDDSTQSVFMFSKGTYILDFLQILFCFGDGGRKQRTSIPMGKSV